MLGFLLEHDGIFEDAQSMKHEGQRSKDPLSVRVSNTEWNDEQCTQNGKVVQHVLPVQKVLGHNITCSRGRDQETITMLCSHYSQTK